MFLPSQLVEISQRLHPDIEDMQALLQAEGLAVGSAECLQELSTRLNSDARFRRDVAFLVWSMLGRKRDGPSCDELGSLEVLGVLVLATAGTQQKGETPSGQRLVRELLRFVTQQRRTAAAPAVTPAATAGPGGALKPTPILPASVNQRERPSLATSVVGSGDTSPTEKVSGESITEVVLSLSCATPELFWRGGYARSVLAVLTVLALLGAWLVGGRGGFKVTTRDDAALPTVHSAVLRASPGATDRERSVVVPASLKLRPSSRKPSPPLTRLTHRSEEEPQTSVLTAVGVNTPPKLVERPETARSILRTDQRPGLSPVLALDPHQESATLSLPSHAGPQRTTPAPVDLSNVFGLPGGADGAAPSQVPSPVFRLKNPTLITRGGAAVVPALHGIVHTGAMGNMASNLMYCPEPEYPGRAIAARVEGPVTVRAVVGPSGNVIDAHVVSGPPMLREAALDAVERWRYRPYEQDGKSVAITTTAILDFQIPPNK